MAEKIFLNRLDTYARARAFKKKKKRRSGYLLWRKKRNKLGLKPLTPSYVSVWAHIEFSFLKNDPSFLFLFFVVSDSDDSHSMMPYRHCCWYDAAAADRRFFLLFFAFFSSVVNHSSVHQVPMDYDDGIGRLFCV